MRKLGIIGGMSWVSTATYYDNINRIVQRRAAPMASAWLVYGVGDCCGRVAVRFGSGLVASRATRRRLAVVTELLRAGGLDVWRG